MQSAPSPSANPGAQQLPRYVGVSTLALQVFDPVKYLDPFTLAKTNKFRTLAACAMKTFIARIENHIASQKTFTQIRRVCDKKKCTTWRNDGCMAERQIDPDLICVIRTNDIDSLPNL